MSTKPTLKHDNGPAAIAAAVTRWDSLAERHRNVRKTLSVLAVIFGPIAVVCVTASRLAGHSVLASVLLGIEIVILCIALMTVYVPTPLRKVHENWVETRMRCEFLRREHALLIARVGPYLSGWNLAGVAAKRIADLEKADSEELLLREDADTSRWLEDLEVASDMSGIDQEACRAYIQSRLAHQKLYFKERSDHHTKLDKGLEHAATAALVLAALFAIWHLVTSLTHLPKEVTESVEPALRYSPVVPAFAAAFLALRAYAGSRRLSVSYSMQHRMVEQLEQEFEALLKGHATATQFKRLVLRAESLFSKEHERWWVVIEPEEPSVGH